MKKTTEDKKADNYFTPSGLFGIDKRIFNDRASEMQKLES